MHTTNVSCFNIGCSTIANKHELKIEPNNPQTNESRLAPTQQIQGLRTPPANKQKAYNPKEEIY